MHCMWVLQLTAGQAIQELRYVTEYHSVSVCMCVWLLVCVFSYVC